MDFYMFCVLFVFACFTSILVPHVFFLAATVYGKGCYFAVNSRYSVDYVDRTSPTKYIILARVVTGDFCKGSSDMKAPPEKLSSTVGGQRYDSTVNDENAPTIFVVFKDSGVYPSYLITFS